MNAIAVAGKDPFEPVVEELLDGAYEPVTVPDKLSRRSQPPAVRFPPEMIAGEEKPVGIEQRAAPGCVARNRNHVELRGERDFPGIVHDPLRIRHRPRIRPVNDPPSPEPLCILRRIRHVVFMGQEDVSDASHSLERLDEMLEIPGRIDQPVAARMLNEVTVGAERLFRVEPAIEHPLVQAQGETRHRRLHSRTIAPFRSDRTDRTSEQGLVRLMDQPIAFRLTDDRRMLAGLCKTSRGQLPAGVAVDTGGIDIKVARDIGIESFVQIGHGISLYLYMVMPGPAFPFFERSAARHRYHEAAVR